MNSLELARKMLLSEVSEAIPAFVAVLDRLTPKGGAKMVGADPLEHTLPTERQKKNEPSTAIDDAMARLNRLVASYADFCGAARRCRPREGLQFDVPGSVVQVLLRKSRAVGDPLSADFVVAEGVYVLSPADWRRLVSATQPDWDADKKATVPLDEQYDNWAKDVVTACEAALLAWEEAEDGEADA